MKIKKYQTIINKCGEERVNVRKSTTKYENILEKRYYFIRDEIIDGLKNGRWPKISVLLLKKMDLTLS